MKESLPHRMVEQFRLCNTQLTAERIGSLTETGIIQYQHAAKGTILAREGQYCERAYYVVNGLVAHSTKGKDGVEHTSFLSKPGDFIFDPYMKTSSTYPEQLLTCQASELLYIIQKDLPKLAVIFPEAEDQIAYCYQQQLQRRKEYYIQARQGTEVLFSLLEKQYGSMLYDLKPEMLASLLFVSRSGLYSFLKQRSKGRHSTIK